MNKRQRKKRYKQYTKELHNDFINFIRDGSLCHRLMFSAEKMEKTRKITNAYIDYYMRAMRYPTFDLTKDGDKIILSSNTGK